MRSHRVVEGVGDRRAHTCAKERKKNAIEECMLFVSRTLFSKRAKDLQLGVLRKSDF